MKWEDVKQLGNEKYKGDGKSVEPIDLYRSGGALRHFCVCNIIKYSWRNRDGKINTKDIDKIIHYAEMLRCIAEEDTDDTVEYIMEEHDKNRAVLKSKGRR